MIGGGLEFLFVILAILIYAVLKINKEGLSVAKFISLIMLPPLFVAMYVFFASLDVYHGNVVRNAFIVSFIAYLFMLPALLLYAVHILSLEKKFSPPAWKLFLWTMLVELVSVIPYVVLIREATLVLVSMITGPMSMAVVYYFSKWRQI